MKIGHIVSKNKLYIQEVYIHLCCTKNSENMEETFKKKGIGLRKPVGKANKMITIRLTEQELIQLDELSDLIAKNRSQIIWNRTLTLKYLVWLMRKDLGL